MKEEEETDPTNKSGFDFFLEMIMMQEGGSIQYDEANLYTVLCSDCFKDEGLKIDAYRIGIEDDLECPNCSSATGHKLNLKILNDLCYRFFVRGTNRKTPYGGSPLIQFNEYFFNKTEIDISPWLKEDVKLIERIGKVGFFYYGPREWMLGSVNPLESLQLESERNEVIEKILNLYPVRELSKGNYFYRLRINPKVSGNDLEYDTAPEEFLGKNRFDSVDFPVLYGSPDLELCIHECRTTVEDKIFVAKLVPTKIMKVLDLTVHMEEEEITEFESIDIAIHFLFLAGNHSYEICREIAKAARNRGLDGIIYPSYFSHLRTGTFPYETYRGVSIRKLPNLSEYVQSQSIPNLALFGRPILENKITVESINKVVLNQVSYNVTFGPVDHDN